MAVASSEPQPRERGMRADARRNHDRILEAARLAFSEEGAGVQMDAVARRGGVGVGTLYRHFPTKEALIRELARHLAEGCARDAEAALEISDPWESIVWLVQRNAEGMALNVGLRDTFAIGPPPGRLPVRGGGARGRSGRGVGPGSGSGRAPRGPDGR